MTSTGWQKRNGVDAWYMYCIEGSASWRMYVSKRKEDNWDWSCIEWVDGGPIVAKGFAAGRDMAAKLACKSSGSTEVIND